MCMDKTEAKQFLVDNGEREFAITLTQNEWAAVGSLMHIAVNAGCPSQWAKTARDKILIANKEYVQANQWPEVI